METFDVSNNKMTGPILSCLSLSMDPSNVWLLNLQNNRLSGNIPIQIDLLSAINFLLLGNNHFSGLIPRQLCQLRDIRIIDFSNNSFSGSIPSCLSNFDSEIGSAHAVELICSFNWSEAGYDFVKPLRELYDSRSLMDSVMLED
ncbi:LRR receptor-like serine/threonine-protein kinase GSO1 isoform X2 [Gossypium australe]|uniref:LRR receptor-like serine/threonine-protein kinase GSO1 isoform X2 n=1 Tax=Gossypium australe TaxID=47621 RepID=A0A5B6VF75_9ROSI|nr:LRR receptor-like serine/threonine-protein kinase GSO1 isoform X2 [Gossypium australe]